MGGGGVGGVETESEGGGKQGLLEVEKLKFIPLICKVPK